MTEAYRNWFKGHGFKEEYLTSLNSGDTQRIKKRIVDSYNYKFVKDNFRYDLNEFPMDFEFYKHVDNSKSKFTEEQFDKAQFKAQIESLIKKHDEYFHSHDLRKFSKYSGMIKESEEQINSVLSKVFPLDLVKRVGIKRIRKEWSVSNTIKKEILQLLFKSFRWTYKFHEKEFDILTLEEFGLECCSRCKSQSENDPHEA